MVLAFYPADFSPVCGDQMALYNEMLNEFQELEAELVGLSVDGAWCHAAEAAEAAGAQENFWGMHDLLFENQSALEDADLVAYAGELSLDKTRLIREVTSSVYALRIREDFKAGVRGGVNGTPTFFINGERYDGPRDVGHFLEALSKQTVRGK